MTTLAAIDVGSNAMRLAIGEVLHHGRVKVLETVRDPVRLGQDAFSQGRLSPPIIERAVEGFHTFRELIGRHHAEHTAAIATSAMREAVNSEDLLSRIRNDTGIHVEIIGGLEEARLMHLAISRKLEIEKGEAMLVDIGGGTTEVAVISLGGIVISHSIRVAGDEIDEQIVDYVRSDHSLLIGERTAETCKIEIGCATDNGADDKTFVRGRDLNTGLPRALELTSGQVREAISPTVDEIVENVKLALEATPPELLADVMEHGIYLAGGGALLNGMDKRLEEGTDIPVVVAPSPLECVVRGTGSCLQNLTAYRETFISDNQYPL